jgi:hypothetical protein
MHPYLESLYSRAKQDEREKKIEDEPFHNSVTGVNDAGVSPRSLNPITPYADQLEESRKQDVATEEETRLSSEAEALQATPEDATASMWAGLTDIGAQTASNYAKASGVQVSGKPFNEASEMVKQKMALRDNLRKNLLDKVQSKKAEREAKKKSLYEQIGMGMKLEDVGRERTEFAQKQEDRARLDEMIPEGKMQLYKDVAARRKVKLDPSWIRNRDENSIREMIGLSPAPDSGSGGRLALPAKLPSVTNVNKALKELGLSPLPEDGTSTLGDVQSAEQRVAEIRRTIGGVRSIDETGAQDASAWLSTQPEKTKMFVAKTVGEFNKDRKAVDSENQDMRLLDTLMDELDKGNAFSGQVLKNRLPRVVGGEKGVLTDQDVNRLSGSQTYWNQLNQFFNNKIAEGSPFTDQDKKEVRAVISAIKNNQGKTLEAAETRAGAVLRSGLGPNAPINLLYGGTQQPSTPAAKSDTIPSDKVRVKNPAGKTGLIPRSQLEAAKKQGYTEVP